MIIAALVFLWSRSRKGGTGAAGITPATGKETSRRRRLDYQPATRPVTPFTRPPVPREPESWAISSIPSAVSVVEGRTDIADSTRAIAEKYSLAGFTLATTDGLVFSSSGNPAATGDAAMYGGRTPGGGGQKTGVTLFTLSYHGINLTGIIRSDRQLTGNMIRMIERDTQEILNRWI